MYLYTRSWVLAIAMLFASPIASADRIGYDQVFDCKAETDRVSATHHHDWSERTRAARWEMIHNTDEVFSAKNTYASLTVRDKKSGAELFKTPTPALTQLWISEDSRFIVGISKIRVWNPFQVVVFNAAGRRLLAQAVDARSFPGVSVSASNWVYWYQEPVPKISIESRDGAYTLHVEGNEGADRAFEFRDVP